MTHSASSPLRELVVVSYELTEESGGPPVAAVGFAEGLAALGLRVIVVALDGKPGRWLVDEPTARARGFELIRVRAAGLARRTLALSSALEALPRVAPDSRALWVNGIWGAQSLAASRFARSRGHALFVRPAGSLGHAALGYKSLKKRAYYALVEGPILRRAAGLHCMSARELRELPDELKPLAFVVPTGVEVAASFVSPTPLKSEVPIVGCLARLHPIKRQHLLLEATVELVRRGVPVRVELAGSVSDVAYERSLRARVESNPELRDRVTFLGHVSREDLASVLSRWTVAALLSEQENFGHAVVTAAAHGVPLVVSPGVALAEDVVQAGAGVVVDPMDRAKLAEALAQALAEPSGVGSERARAFAGRFAWSSVSGALLDELSGRVAHSRKA